MAGRGRVAAVAVELSEAERRELENWARECQEICLSGRRPGPARFWPLSALHGGKAILNHYAKLVRRCQPASHVPNNSG